MLAALHLADQVRQLEQSAEAARAQLNATAEAGRRYGIPVFGTMAHSFVQAHDRERDAFAGYTTVAIFPTETAETIGYVLGHSEASLLFVGKLDDWKAMQPGIPKDMPCISTPLCEAKGFTAWDDIVGKTQPMKESPTFAGDGLARGNRVDRGDEGVDAAVRDDDDDVVGRIEAGIHPAQGPGPLVEREADAEHAESVLPRALVSSILLAIAASAGAPAMPGSPGPP